MHSLIRTWKIGTHHLMFLSILLIAIIAIFIVLIRAHGALCGKHHGHESWLGTLFPTVLLWLTVLSLSTTVVVGILVAVWRRR